MSAAESIIQAIELIESRLDYYEVVHTAQCDCWKNGHHENLKYCTCGVGKAWRIIRREVEG